jgi:LPXTG-motif cell wall-anchored protein
MGEFKMACGHLSPPFLNAAPPARSKAARSRLVAALLLLLIGAAFCSSASAEDEIDLKTIHAALESYESSIKTLEGIYTSHSIGTPQRARPLMMEDLRFERKFAYDLATGRSAIESGQTWLYSEISRTQRFSQRQRNAFDGERFYALLNTTAASPLASDLPRDVPHNLNLSRNDETRSYYCPRALSGLRLKDFGVSLADLIDRSEATLAGRDNVDGTMCYRISIRRPGIETTAWLDPGRDFLFRALERRRVPRAGTDEDAQRVGQIEMIEIQEFGEFPDIARNEPRWFPVRATVRNPGRLETIKIESLSINPPLEDDRFRFDPATLPDGVRVTDRSVRQKEVISFTGNRPDLWESVQALVDAESKEMRELVDRAAPDPPAPIPKRQQVRELPATGIQDWVWALVAGSLLLLVRGVWCLMRRGPEQRDSHQL